MGHIFRSSNYQFLKLNMKGKIEGQIGIGRKKHHDHALFRAAQDQNEYAITVAKILRFY